MSPLYCALSWTQSPCVAVRCLAAASPVIYLRGWHLWYCALAKGRAREGGGGVHALAGCLYTFMRACM